MAVRISKLVIALPGQVTRKYDGKCTELTVDEEQARSLYDQLTPVLHFFDSQHDS